MHSFDFVMQRKAVELLSYEGAEVLVADQISHDVVVDGCTEEWKFFRNVYREFYFELYQCGDPSYCQQCQALGNEKILLGWAHRKSYCTADYIRVFWCSGDKLKQEARVPRRLILDWLWDVYLSNNGKGKIFRGISNWDGWHRTLGLAIPFSDIPTDLLSLRMLSYEEREVGNESRNKAKIQNTLRLRL